MPVPYNILGLGLFYIFFTNQLLQLQLSLQHTYCEKQPAASSMPHFLFIIKNPLKTWNPPPTTSHGRQKLISSMENVRHGIVHSRYKGESGRPAHLLLIFTANTRNTKRTSRLPQRWGDLGKRQTVVVKEGVFYLISFRQFGLEMLWQ